jgi:hypothetical protein
LTNTSKPAPAKTNDVSVMTEPNRKAARVFSDILVGTYFLVLLALLLYAAYRYWRHQQNPARKFRHRI